LAVPRPREGGLWWGEIFAYALLQPARSFCVSLIAFSFTAAKFYLSLSLCLCTAFFLESKKAEDCPKQKADHTALIADSMEKPDPGRSC